jgi:hypothetical protein
MTCTAKPSRLDVIGSKPEGIDHLGSAEISLAGGTATTVLATSKALYRGEEGIFSRARHELLNQRLEPVWRFPHEPLVNAVRAVKCGITGT